MGSHLMVSVLLHAKQMDQILWPFFAETFQGEKDSLWRVDIERILPKNKIQKNQSP